MTAVGPDGIAVHQRVRSSDYGDGTIVLDLGERVQVIWDEPMVGTFDHHALLHDRSYVERLERL